ncbi:MAG: hypothetical protein ACREYC_09890 [Gammaproteobacteria bacterium]
MAIVRSLWRNRQLVWQLAKREVVGRYRGSVMGLAWSFLHLLLMLTATRSAEMEWVAADSTGRETAVRPWFATRAQGVADVL